ncbi:MAG: BrnT family toxin [Candidatus Rokubacteria bacterium]|nr:BrnT family toxin [Candidatus Rokubacteria bacterium]
MPWIKGFVWDEENVSHIAKHDVTPGEVEEALTDVPVVFRGPDGRYLAHGQTGGGRLLFVVYATRPGGRIRVITARDMTESEKRLWRRRRTKGHR